MNTVKFEVSDKIATITMSRPEKLNAINEEMVQELFEAFHEVNTNDDIWVAVLAGEGRAFSAGHDLVASGGNEHRVPKPGVPTGGIPELYVYLGQLEKPIIAAVHGYAVGGAAGMALLSDFRIVADDAKFLWPQVTNGMASISGPTMLTHYVPFGQAMMMLYTGTFLDADNAYRVGLAQEIVPKARHMERVYEIARTIAQNAPLAVRTIKQAAVSGRSIPDFAERVKNSQQWAAKIRESEDSKEGLRAFAEKRVPEFRGR